MIALKSSRHERLYNLAGNINVRFQRDPETQTDKAWGIQLERQPRGLRKFLRSPSVLMRRKSVSEPVVLGQPVTCLPTNGKLAKLVSILWSEPTDEGVEQQYVSITPLVNGRVPLSWGQLSHNGKVNSWPVGAPGDTLVGPVRVEAHHDRVSIHYKLMTDEAIVPCEAHVAHYGPSHHAVDVDNGRNHFIPLRPRKR